MNDISIVRGTTNTLNVTLKDPDGGAYVLADGEVLRFGVKCSHADREYLIRKDLTSADYKNGVYPVTLRPEDTASLPCCGYCYDVGVQSGEDYYNVIECSTLTVARNITSKEAVSDG